MEYYLKLTEPFKASICIIIHALAREIADAEGNARVKAVSYMSNKDNHTLNCIYNDWLL